MTSGTVARQAPLSMEFPRQDYWSGLPFPSPGDLSDPGSEPAIPALQAGSLPLSHLNPNSRELAPKLASTPALKAQIGLVLECVIWEACVRMLLAACTDQRSSDGPGLPTAGEQRQWGPGKLWVG